MWTVVSSSSRSVGTFRKVVDHHALGCRSFGGWSEKAQSLSCCAKSLKPVVSNDSLYMEGSRPEAPILQLLTF